jgi:predicted nicotinamide N-methyase
MTKTFSIQQTNKQRRVCVLAIEKKMIKAMNGGGYCHFNEGKGDERLFQIHLCGRDISLRQNPSTHEIGHGAVVWDASVIFAKYVENNPTDFDPSKLKGKRVLELGSGCGLAGITLMMKGCAVTFTDMEKVIVALTDRNVNVRFLFAILFITIYLIFLSRTFLHN